MHSCEKTSGLCDSCGEQASFDITEAGRCAVDAGVSVEAYSSAGACFTFFRFRRLTKAGQEPGTLMELMCFWREWNISSRIFLFQKSIWKLFWKFRKIRRCCNREMDNRGRISSMELLTDVLTVSTHHPWEGPLHLTLTWRCIVSESPVSSERLLWRLHFMQRSAGLGKNKSIQ